MRNIVRFNSIADWLKRHRPLRSLPERLRQQWRTSPRLLALRVACVAVLVYALFMIVTVIADRSANERVYEAVRELYADDSTASDERAAAAAADGPQAGLAVPAAPASQAAAATAARSAQAPSAEERAAIRQREAFGGLLQLNGDVVGWLTVPDTRIDYPVVQAADNDYYLKRNVLGQENDGGSIFMDYRNTQSPLSAHTILYGHHMRDGSMFKHLTKFKERTFAEEHRVFTFETLAESAQWEIFAVYLTDTSFNYIKTDFADDGDFEQFIDSLVRRSYMDFGVKPTAADRILTLSTCDYAVSDGRLVVHARKMGSADDDN